MMMSDEEMSDIQNDIIEVLEKYGVKEIYEAETEILLAVQPYHTAEIERLESEVERLRGALKEIEITCPYDHSSNEVECVNILQEIAEKALTQGEAE